MPRFAFALPVAPAMWDEWRKTAMNIPLYQSREHRLFLLTRGIFREKVWLQRGEGSPELTLVLWDLDDVEQATRATGTMSDHEVWLGERILSRLHDVDLRVDRALPRPELLSGTTITATQSADTQAMFALPLPEGAEPAVRALMHRVEDGDLQEPHEGFLARASIHEEWIWLQPAIGPMPALLLVHWIGDELPNAWRQLAEGSDAYSRVLRDSLFTRLVGLPPRQVSGWVNDLVLQMHVRRSDTAGPDLRRRALRLLGALVAGRRTEMELALTPDASGVREDGHGVHSPSEVLAALEAAMRARDEGGGLLVRDVLASDTRVLGLLGTADATSGRPLLAVLLTFESSKITHVHLSSVVPSSSLLGVSR